MVDRARMRREEARLIIGEDRRLTLLGIGADFEEDLFRTLEERQRISRVLAQPLPSFRSVGVGDEIWAIREEPNREASVFCDNVPALPGASNEEAPCPSPSKKGLVVKVSVNAMLSEPSG